MRRILGRQGLGVSVWSVAVCVVVAGWASGALAQMPPGRVSIRRPGTMPPRTPKTTDPGQYHYDLAKVHERYGKKEATGAAYAKASEMAKNPTLKSRILAEWGQWLVKNGKSEEGVKRMREAFEATKDNRAKCRQALSLARALEKARKPEEAATLYEYVMANAEDKWLKSQAQRQYFSAYKRAGKLKELVKRYTDRLVKNPKDEAALQALFYINTRLVSKPKEAMKYGEQLAKLKPGDTQVTRQLADLYLRSGASDKAVSLFEFLAKADPKQSRYYYGRIVDAYLKKKQNDKALEWAKRLLEQDKKSSYAWSRLGSTYMRAGKNAEAVDAMKEAVKVAKTDYERESHMLQLAGVYTRLKKDHDAILLYGKLAETAKSQFVKKRAKRELFMLYERKGLLDKVQFKTPAKKGK